MRYDQNVPKDNLCKRIFNFSMKMGLNKEIKKILNYWQLPQ